MSRRILIVDDDPTMEAVLAEHFRRRGYEADFAPSAEAALSRLSAFDPDVVITDVRMGGMDGLDLLARLRAAGPRPAVIVITGYETMRTTIEAIRTGAYEYLVKPVELEHLDLVVHRCLRDLSSAGAERSEVSARAASEPLAVGSAPEMVEIYKLIGRLASIRCPVLIRGETGTGKELVARAIHQYSPWAGEPFVAVNCASLTETLLESELFGHVRGAFTGAVGERRGRFELAGSGTLFLDEIGDTTPGFQAKLLRVIQEREFLPVGGERVRRTEARVIAATHRPLEELVVAGVFREDLYYRLRVVEISVPPLRERRADIPVLTDHLLATACRGLGRDVPRVTGRVRRMLRDYGWPGNVRELENALLRGAVLCRGSALGPEHISLGQTGDLEEQGQGEDIRSVHTLAQVQRAHVRRAMRLAGENKSRAARLLGISRPRLDRLLAQQREGDVLRSDVAT